MLLLIGIQYLFTNSENLLELDRCGRAIQFCKLKKTTVYVCIKHLFKAEEWWGGTWTSKNLFAGIGSPPCGSWGNHTQAIRLGNKCLYPLSKLAGPYYVYFKR